MNTQKHLSMQDVANHAGVSKATVSLTLRSDPRISEKTREKVLRSIKELGYVTHPMVAALMTSVRQRQQPDTMEGLAFLVPGTQQYLEHLLATHHPYCSVSRVRARELGFNLEPFYVDGKVMRPTRISEIFKARGIRGILIGPQDVSDSYLPLIDLLEWQNFSGVLFGHNFSQFRIHSVRSHHRHGMTVCLAKLKEANYGRVGLVFGRQSNALTGSSAYGAFLAYQAELPARNRVPAILDPNEALLRKWLAQYKPDAVLAGSQLSFFPKPAALLAVLPAGIGFASLNVPRGGQISGICPQLENIALTAVNLLVGKLLRNEKGLEHYPIETLVEGEWSPGETLSPRP